VNSLSYCHICPRALCPATGSGRLLNQDWDNEELSEQFVGIVIGELGLSDAQVYSLRDGDPLYVRFIFAN